MGILKKIQDKPKGVRKAIFWVIVILIGIIFFFAWVQAFKTRIGQSKLQKPFGESNAPSLDETLKNFPSIEMPKFPDISEDEWKELEKQYEQDQKGQGTESAQPTTP